MEAFDDHQTFFGSPVADLEIYREGGHNDEDKTVGSDGGIDTRSVLRGILGSEDQTAGNTANATKSHQQGAAECSLPLTTDVVCLIALSAWFCVCLIRRCLT